MNTSTNNLHPTRLAFAGRMMVGKSTAAKYFCQKYQQLHETAPCTLAIADRLKICVAALFKLTGSAIYTQEGKQSRIQIQGLEQYTVRQMLQLVGEALRDRIDEDIWIKLLIDQIRYQEKYGPSDLPILVDDVRYPNEAAALHDQGFMIIGIVRDTGMPTDHPSEQGIGNLYTDYVIENNGTLEDFYQKLLCVPEYARELKR